MKEIVSFTLLAGGSQLTISGVSAYASARYKIFRRFPGSPTNKAKLMLIGGVVVTVIGLVGLLQGSKES